MNKPSLEIQRRERTARFLWTVLILMFFMIQGVIWTVAIYATSRDSSHAVVAGYDEQAMHWDEVKLRRQTSAALRWEADIKVDSAGDIHGNRIVTLSLKDQNQLPLESAVVKLVAFHRGRAAEPQNLSLKPVAPGIYSGNVRVRKIGNWQFSGSAISNEDQFLIEQQITLNSNRNQ